MTTAPFPVRTQPPVGERLRRYGIYATDRPRVQSSIRARILPGRDIETYHDPDRCSRWHPIEFAYETFHNFGSFDSGRDFGYTVGAAYGPAIFSQERGAWYVYYAWVDIQQESVFTPVAQDDFLRATNFRGHMVGVAWYFLNRAELRRSFLSDTPLDPIAGSDETEWRGRLDLTVNF